MICEIDRSDHVKYIGLDVHKEAIAIAVVNGAGKLVMESIVETKSSTVLDFLHGLRGELHVTLEEGIAPFLFSRCALYSPEIRVKRSSAGILDAKVRLVAVS